MLARRSLAFLAGAMAVAILRHHLYGLDVHVNRALVYTALTLLLGGLYVAAVLGLGRLLGQDASLGIALPATALVAVAFQPLRDWLQRSVNRLLYGQRDEPYAAISSLGRRLGEAIGQADVGLPYVAVELAAPADGLAAVLDERQLQRDPRRGGAVTAVRGRGRSSSAPAPTAKPADGDGRDDRGRPHSARPTVVCSRTSRITRPQP